MTNPGSRVRGLRVCGYPAGEAPTRESALVRGFAGEGMGATITRGFTPAREPAYLRGFVEAGSRAGVGDEIFRG